MKVVHVVLMCGALAACSRASRGGSEMDAAPAEPAAQPVSAATLRANVPGAALPSACSLFTQELAARVSTIPLKPGGNERVSDHIRFCFYTVDGKPVARIGAALTTDMGATAEKYDCIHPPAETLPGRLVDGIGQWGCMTGDHILTTGNGNFRVTIFGDANVDALKAAANDLFVKLANAPLPTAQASGDH